MTYTAYEDTSYLETDITFLHFSYELKNNICNIPFVVNLKILKSLFIRMSINIFYKMKIIKKKLRTL